MVWLPVCAASPALALTVRSWFASLRLVLFRGVVGSRDERSRGARGSGGAPILTSKDGKEVASYIFDIRSATVSASLNSTVDCPDGPRIRIRIRVG